MARSTGILLFPYVLPGSPKLPGNFLEKWWGHPLTLNCASGLTVRESDMKTLTVGQLASLAGISVEAVRFYEREGLLDEANRGVSSGYREFPPSAIKRLRFIQRAKHLGFTLKEIRNLLAIWVDRDADHEPICQAVDDKVADLDTRAHELLEKAQTLKELCATCRMDALAHECPVMRALAGEKWEGGELPAGIPTPARCRANHGSPS